MDAYTSLPMHYEENGGGEEKERICRQGHRTSLELRTSGGGCICLACFSQIFTNSTLGVHTAYALSQLSRALDDSLFINTLLQNNRHFLVSPLSEGICSCRDLTLATDITHVITKLCAGSISVINDDEDDHNSLVQDFIHHLLLHLASSALLWTPTLTYALHCLGLLLELHCNSSTALPNSLRNQKVFMSNLVSGLHLPGDEIRGEILFVLYKLLNLKDGLEELLPFCPLLTHLAVDVLFKAESDELRTNCLAVLTMLARQAIFHISIGNDGEENDSPIVIDKGVKLAECNDRLVYGSIVRMFAEAVKGPLLSTDVQVQISTLELIHYYTYQIEGIDVTENLNILVEEGLADYIFEILRVSDNMEPIVMWGIRILSLLSRTKQVSTQRFTVGFTTVIKILSHVAGIPLHPVQTDTLVLISAWLSSSPGIISTGQAEDLLLTLTKMLNQHGIGDIGLSSEAFNAVCSAFTALLKTPSCHAIKGLTVISIHPALKNAILSVCNNQYNENMLYCLYLLREIYAFTQNTSSREASSIEVAKANLIEICEICLLPSINVMSENQETTKALLQTFSIILNDTSLVQTKSLAERLAGSSWFSFSFECLARFPLDDVRDDVFLIFSLLIDHLSGDGMGDIVREVSCNLAVDPVDLLFLLGQISCHSSELLCTQSAIISVLHTSYLYGDRFADESEVLASLEQYILVNSSNFQCPNTNHATLTQIVDLYALIRDGHMNYPLSYSVEAEKLLLRVISDCECDVFSARMPKAVLRWLFQQDEIQEFLMVLILNFCKCYNAEKVSELGFQCNHTLENQSHGRSRFDIVMLAELIEQEDCGTAVLVFLLNQMIDQHLDDDLSVVLHVVMRIMDIFPGAANSFCERGILASLHRFYFVTTSSETLISMSMLLFSILCFAKLEAFREEDFWLAIANQVIRMLVGKLKDKNSSPHESVILFSVLSLILQKSKPEEGLLMESSKAIVSNNHLGSIVESIIENACARGAALSQLDEQTSSGQLLCSALIYQFFWLRRFRAVFQDFIYDEGFVFLDCLALHGNKGSLPDILKDDRASLPINIPCQKLCQLMYFGSPLIKLITSYSLVEVFSHIAEKRTDGQNSKRELQCSPDFLESILIVLQGFILHDSVFLAWNVASCIYWLLGCEYLNATQTKAIQSSNWYRLILEELTLSLANPNPSSHCVNFSGKPKPTAYIAIALLRMSSPPAWIKSVLSPLCITSIIDNLCSLKPGAEIVLLFRSLLSNGYIEQIHIRKLHHLFQDFRRSITLENSQDQYSNNHKEKWSCSINNYNKIMVDLIISSSIDPVTAIWTHTSKDQKEVNSALSRLIAEIDKFLQESAIYARRIGNPKKGKVCAFKLQFSIYIRFLWNFFEPVP